MNRIYLSRVYIKAYATSQDEHPQIVTISENVPIVWHEQCNLLARGVRLSFDGNYRRSSTGKDKLSSRRVRNHVDGRRAYPEDIPQPTTGRGRGREPRDQKRSWKSLPVIYIGPRISGNRGRYPKVVSARTGLQSN